MRETNPPRLGRRTRWRAAASLLMVMLAGTVAQARPVTLHARIDLTDTMTTEGLNSRLQSSFHVRTPATQGGAGGPRASFSDADPMGISTIQGDLHGIGNFDVTGDGASMHEAFDMHTVWSNAMAPRQPGYAYLVPPKLSDFGDGLDIQIKLKLPIDGTWRLALNGQSVDDRAASKATPLNCRLSSTTQAWCEIDLSMSPSPTFIRDPQFRKNPDVQRVLAQMQEAAGNAEARPLLAQQGQWMNVPTQWLPSGHFVMQLAGTFGSGGEAGGGLARHADITVWSSDPGDDREPKR